MRRLMMAVMLLWSGGLIPARTWADATRPAVLHPNPSELEERARYLRSTLSAGFTVVVESPFVVVGDESPARVRERVETRVRWTRDLLLQDFFPVAPQQIIEVWIFRNRSSYERHSRDLFNEVPTSPYGFYLPGRAALLLNIAPGDGTLVHELVHPFVQANAPDAPAWLNEGLASLFERPHEVDGHLRGEVNWRLPALQGAIAQHRLEPLAWLVATSDAAFYDDDRGENYAEARYLCFYLQEKGLLREFVSRYLEHQKDDPTGAQSLLDVLGRKELSEVDPDFQRVSAQLRAR